VNAADTDGKYNVRVQQQSIYQIARKLRKSKNFIALPAEQQLMRVPYKINAA